MTTRTKTHLRRFLVGLAVVRFVVGLCAIPLAPFLYREHFVVLVLMRPTKEVLLAGGFLVRLGDVALLPIVVASLPLTVFGVWHFYWLARLYRREIGSGKMPNLVRRVLSPDRIKKMRALLDKRGLPLVFLGRLAVFPSTIVGAAAGSGRMRPRPFLLTDGIAAVVSIVEVLAAGFVLGEAYERAGPWITAIGVVALIAVALIVALSLRRD